MRNYTPPDDLTTTLPCPACGEPVPENSVWSFGDKVYCCEGCCRKAVGGQ